MWSQPGPEQTPDTFHGVDVNLVDAVSIKLLPTCQTAISLSGMLTLVPTLSGDLVQGYRKVERSSAPVQEPTGADSKNPDFIARRSSPEFAVNRILTASSTLRWPWRKRSGTYPELACPPTGLKRSGDGGKAVPISIQPCRAGDARRS